MVTLTEKISLPTLYKKTRRKYYEIKVTIRESHPPTWGRLRIPANITFNRDNWVHDIIIEKEINEEIEYPLCIKAKSGAYPEDCGGTWGYEEYYQNDEGREELDIDFINDELEGYKDFAKDLYDREMF